MGCLLKSFHVDSNCKYGEIISTNEDILRDFVYVSAVHTCNGGLW
jgi:hypothetical protein